MPPLLPKSSLSSLARARCPHSALSLPIRTFSTTPLRAAIGPENPKFIEIPVAPQHQAPVPRIVKGTLPVPRQIFRKRGINKTSESYLAAATRESQNPKEPANDHIAWKQRLAATRRQSLREGLVELEIRKNLQDAAVAARSKSRTALREHRVSKAQRMDERLTNPTIKAATKALQTTLPDPNRAQRVAASAERVLAIQKEKEEARRDALHTLYMNARNFITTEQQLDAKVEEIFIQKPHGDEKSDNIWDINVPPTVQNMLNTVGDTSKKAIFYGSGPAATTLKRMKRIAEELTGGKMDIDGSK